MKLYKIQPDHDDPRHVLHIGDNCLILSDEELKRIKYAVGTAVERVRNSGRYDQKLMDMWSFLFDCVAANELRKDTNQ